MLKKIIIVLILSIVVICLIINIPSQKNEYLRIHIRANSNAEIDQTVKYDIKEKIVDYLCPIVSNCKSKEQLIVALNNSLCNIESIADIVLSNKDLNYTSKAKINNEFFPTRVYDDLTLESGYYDALILELGEARGNNWWCVIYPPLCFTNVNYGTNYQNVVYKSRIREIIDEYNNRE